LPSEYSVSAYQIQLVAALEFLPRLMRFALLEHAAPRRYAASALPGCILSLRESSSALSNVRASVAAAIQWNFRRYERFADSAQLAHQTNTNNSPPSL